MAFFGITQLGYQDPVREHVRDPRVTPVSAFRSGQYRDPNCRVTSHNDNVDDQTTSNQELQHMKQRHKTYGNKDNTEVYRRSPTTSADIGQWRKDEPLYEREPWTYVKRHVHKDSEMTRFVNEMALTNRDFSLF